MRHEDMCYSNDCIYCYLDQQQYKEAEAIQKYFMQEYSAEGKKECAEDWETNSPNFIRKNVSSRKKIK
eukprot:scaffold15992_cov63-Attheya_sp.AAC.1